MSERHSDNDGSDIFWPGYVDAVTNLVLNLLFLLTIMIIAVFMFALELGRGSMGGAGRTPIADYKPGADGISKGDYNTVKENVELKLEIQRLNAELAKYAQQSERKGGLVASVEVAAKPKATEPGLDNILADGLEVVVRFKDEAVTFSPEEHNRFIESLKPMLKGNRVKISVDVPTGFSEAKRMGFYRAMAVRNLLIEMKVPKDRIDVAVVEGKRSANASIVKVRAY